MDKIEKQKVWFREARHLEEIKGALLDTLKNKDDWRKIRERMKTVSVALVLCLNVGVDPPDVKKPIRCARKEAWVDPSISNPQRSAQKIAQSLQKIYEKLQPRARYKSAIDPTVDCVRKLCTSMRRNAKDERVLFHFNGHGVPKPTDAGEIWVFNKNITQYIPLSLYELQSWMGVPSVYLWDCNSAGTIVNMFMRFAEDHSIRWMDEYQMMREREQQQQQHYPSQWPGPSSESTHSNNGQEQQRSSNDRGNNDAASNASTSSHSVPTYKNCIQLGACAPGETLPFNCVELPADLFTCCLITPIQTSLLCHMLKMGVKNRFPPNIIEEIPGVLTDRRTLLGELNWIFTAITDTIAWSCLPMDTFQKLFRQDLLIASLFRSFLLAQRIMLENGCHVVSTPELPSVHAHPLWEYWDYVLDLCISNMYNLLLPKQNIIQFTRNDCFIGSSLKHNLLIELSVSALTEMEYTYSWFFIEQLQAFEMWLKFSVNKQQPPQQLPVVLQVLLSQIHRVRALGLLARFVDLGPWAVVSALSVGIFPYVLKLLQCGTKELRPALAFIWAKILAIDPMCQHELVKDNGYCYFLQVLSDSTVSARMKIVSSFVMATIIYNNYRPAQEKLVESDYVSLCIELLSNPQMIQCRMLCLWILIGLGRLWSECDKARWQAIRNVAYDKAIEFLNDDVPEVRAAAVYALGCFVHNTSRNNEHATAVENEVCDKLCEKCIYDGSIIVRAELAAAIQWFVIDFQSRFAGICIDLDRKISAKQKNGAQQQQKIRNMFGNGTIHAGAGAELQRTLASMKLSPTESGFVDDEAENEDPSNLPGPSNSGDGRNSIAGTTVNDTNKGIKRAGSSVYSILPRSASSVLYSSRNRQRTSSLVSKSDGPTIVLPGGLHLDLSSTFKYRVLSHILSLESKTFIGPFERIWLCILRLALDPCEDVAKMGECITNYIFDLASKIREARNKVLEYKQKASSPMMTSTAKLERIGRQSIDENGEATTSRQSSASSSGNTEQSAQVSNSSVRFCVGSPAVSTSVPTTNAIVLTQQQQQSADENRTSFSTIDENKSCADLASTSKLAATAAPCASTNSLNQDRVSTAAETANTEQQQKQQQQQQIDNNNIKRRLLMDTYIHQSLYTPKRSIFGTQSGSYSQVNHDISDTLLHEQATTIATEGLVQTKFVDWCAKTWTEPIYKTIYDDGCISTRNSLVNSETPFTVEQPTDWAIHMHDGIRQRAKKELELLKAKQARCELQCMKLKMDSPATSIAWSFLRPYIYISDAGTVRIYSYPTGEVLPQQASTHHQTSPQKQKPTPPPPNMLCCEWQVGTESFLFDAISDLFVANGLTHELLMTGSRNGLLKIWDPQFDSHSYAFEGNPKLVTAAYLLNDLPRMGKGNRTLYHWDQDCGRLICAGNVRVCRIWDAWAEKAIFDIPIRHSKGSVVSIDSDLQCDLVSCGFSDGTLAVYDVRLPSEECEIMRLRDSHAPIVGMGILRERQRLLIGTRDGFVRLWEPRMFQEPISEFNVPQMVTRGGYNLPSDNSKLLNRLEVQKKGELVACALADSSVYMFDIDGREGVLSRLRCPTSGRSGSYFYSPVSAIGGLSSLILRHTRRRSSSGESHVDADNHMSLTVPSTSISTIPDNPASQAQEFSAMPAAMRIHQYRPLLGIATMDCQFRAFAMPNMENVK